ncbi:MULTISPECIES: hypothetical protein [unclassified Fusibacter]|uniref:hypothetical protein n=1 Tax=unclassified Fusibacter TaxID=2624464 RepID=UPI001011269B|nr:MULTISPECIES: hypothetical protein [unclassified Fusibacter]MCK8059288.1 hypothetical protein [Fusibacter sp. A2]NPE21248.1 hypothetical protein [Fusibacter sp. A1]RXV62513.1 hypothetical protein DWB64_05380 [Fusibacter sp. A1]
MKKRYWKIVIVILLSAMFSVYVSRLYEVKKTPPSENWSHHVMIADEVDGYMKRRLGILPASDGFYTYFIKHDSFHLIHSSPKAETSEVLSLADFGSDIVKVAAHWDETGSLLRVLVLDEEGIRHKGLTLDGAVAFDQVLYEGSYGDVRSIQIFDSLILLQFLDEYQLLDAEGIVIETGEINYKTKMIASEKDSLVYMHISDLDQAKIVVYGSDGIRVKEFDVTEPNERDILGYAQSIDVFDQKIAVTFSKFKSSEKKTTRFTTMIWDGITNELIRKDSGLFGYTDEPVQVKGVTQEKTELVITGSTKFGSNVLKTSIYGEDILERYPLTKTLRAVTNPIYFELDGEEYVVWFDVEDEMSAIMLASTNEVVVKDSYASLDLSLTTMVGNGIMGIFGSLLMVMHAGSIIVLPCVFLIFLSLWLQGKKGFKSEYAVIFVMVAHVAIKLYYVMVLMEPESLSIMFEQFFGNGALVAGVLVLTSLIVAVATFNYRKHHELDSEHYTYAFFAVVDLAALMLTYQVYGYSMLMLTRL